MPGAPRNSFKAKLPLIIFGGMLVFVFAIGAVWLYGVLAPLNNWPEIQFGQFAMPSQETHTSRAA